MRVLTVDAAKNKVAVTLKKTLVKTTGAMCVPSRSVVAALLSSAPLTRAGSITTYEDAKPGTIADGFVTATKDAGCARRSAHDHRAELAH